MVLGLFRKKSEIRDLSVHETYELVSDGKVVLIDVRQPDEWESTGRPQGAKGVTLQDPEFVDKVLALSGNKKSPLAMSCRTGVRGMESANILAAAKFTDVANVVGGFVEWERQGLPVDYAPFDD